MSESFFLVSRVALAPIVLILQHFLFFLSDDPGLLRSGTRFSRQYCPLGSCERYLDRPGVIRPHRPTIRSALAYTAIHRPGDLLPQSVWVDIFTHLDWPCGHVWECPAGLQTGFHPAFREQAGQFRLDRRLHLCTLARSYVYSVQDQPLDIDVDIHGFAPVTSFTRNSDSLIGFSSLRNSVRAASRISGTVTDFPAAAARNAAFRAMLWILPPVTLSRAR